MPDQNHNEIGRFVEGNNANPTGANGTIKGYQSIRRRLRFLVATQGWTVKSILETYTDSAKFDVLPFVDGLAIRYCAITLMGKPELIEAFINQHDGPQKAVFDDDTDDGVIDKRHKEFLGALYEHFEKQLAMNRPQPVKNGHANGHDESTALVPFEPDGNA